MEVSDTDAIAVVAGYKSFSFDKISSVVVFSFD